MEIAKNIYSNKILKYIVIAFAGSILLTISAKIKIPFYPVPMTMQTFVVILLGITFGYKAGAAAVCLYLIEGISGLPVFSNSPEKGVGLSYFMGPTMGYLIGFIFAAVIAFPSSSFLSLTCFESQKTTYQIKPAVIYINIASKSAIDELLPKRSFNETTI